MIKILAFALVCSSGTALASSPVDCGATGTLQQRITDCAAKLPAEARFSLSDLVEPGKSWSFTLVSHLGADWLWLNENTGRLLTDASVERLTHKDAAEHCRKLGEALGAPGVFSLPLRSDLEGPWLFVPRHERRAREFWVNEHIGIVGAVGCRETDRSMIAAVLGIKGAPYRERGWAEVSSSWSFESVRCESERLPTRCVARAR